jgi:hypothetical protein
MATHHWHRIWNYLFTDTSSFDNSYHPCVYCRTVYWVWSKSFADVSLSPPQWGCNTDLYCRSADQRHTAQHSTQDMLIIYQMQWVIVWRSVTDLILIEVETMHFRAEHADRASHLVTNIWTVQFVSSSIQNVHAQSQYLPTLSRSQIECCQQLLAGRHNECSDMIGMSHLLTDLHIITVHIFPTRWQHSAHLL